MKIAILCPTFFAFYGIDRVVANQASELMRQRHQVTIFTFTGEMEPPPDVRLERIGMPKGFLAQKVYFLLFPLDFIKAIKWVLRLKTYDVIYSHHHPMNWLAYLTKKFYGVKYIYYHHHFNPPQAFPNFIERTYTRLRLPLEKWTISRADAAISVSQHSRRQLKQETGLDSEVVYNRVDAQRFHSGIDGTQIRQRHNLGEAPIILFVGQTSPTKGTHLLLEAFNLVKGQIPDAKLMIVGEHPNGNYLRRLKRMSNSSVIFTGGCPDDELPCYYAACNVYATASLREGFNLPLAEAQACGKPVVAFDVGPHPEVVQNKETGVLVPRGDLKAMAQAIIRFVSRGKV
jgi:1,2-diacylglycerol 3-alpha-glucosyltransferase